MKTKHAPLPWGSQRTEGDLCEVGSDADQTRVGLIEGEGNAAHIVKCVNAHDEARAAIRAALEHCDGVRNALADTIHANRNGERIRQLRAVLAKMEGK